MRRDERVNKPVFLESGRRVRCCPGSAVNSATRMAGVRLRLREEALSRYRALRAKGRNDAESRNVAVAWTRQRLKFYSSAVIRRELDRALDPPRSHRTDGDGPTLAGHWSLPT